MRNLNELEMGLVGGGEAAPDAPTYPGGMTEAEWLQWEEFFKDQEMRNP